jgi:hypothetical protein
MLGASEVTRVRTVVEGAERIVAGVNRLLQRDGAPMPVGLLDMRARRVGRELIDLEKLILEMSRLCQELMVEDWLVREGISSAGQERAS